MLSSNHAIYLSSGIDHKRAMYKLYAGNDISYLSLRGCAGLFRRDKTNLTTCNNIPTKIISLYKRGDRNQCEDYTGTSLLNTV